MGRIGVCGNFGKPGGPESGQTVKTNMVYQKLCEAFLTEPIEKLSTTSWKSELFTFFFRVIGLVKHNQHIVFMLAQNGVKFMLPFFVAVNRLFRHKLHYVVIGGWLPEFVQENPGLLKDLKRLDGIYVETKIMQKKLEEQGLFNVFHMPNFKDMEILEVPENPTEFAFCTFSRVIREKGIEDAIAAVEQVNRDGISARLDIYGPVAPAYAEDFDRLMQNVPEYIGYKGSAPSGDAVRILQGYTALLFPTHYSTEGVPGTLIDAFSAGVPVISYDWQYSHELICVDKTGYIVPMGDINGLSLAMKRLISHSEDAFKMRKNCICEAEKYLPENAMDVLLERLS